MKELLKNLPKIDEIMLVLKKRGILKKAPRDVVLSACRSVVGDTRELILSAKKDDTNIHVPSLDEVADAVIGRIENLRRYSLRRVVNATGVILHTNLGRAPLGKEALERILEVSCGYSNLEFDLEKGKRGLRYDHVQRILCELSGAEDALVVNNNAAAVLLVLNTLALGKEAIVSRGELIEIGGEFRIPEVMEKSGAILREIGTTNRTHLSDYEDAVNNNTGLILKVHTSNFRIVGFTEEIGLPALVEIGKNADIPVMNDLGSGCFVELDRYGFEREPTVQEVLKTGVDVVTFSGDKLLGGPQAGIILGNRDILQKIKKNPLNRALRIDKLTLAALEATMKQYLNGEDAVSGIRILRAITEPLADVEKRAKKLLTILKKSHIEGLVLVLKEGTSMTGGGALPTQEIPTMLLSIKSPCMSAGRLGERLRHCEVPVVVRIAEDEVLIDSRTVDEEEFAFIEEGLQQVFAEDV
ncbi:MAG: L-seryl-tRNA(Sec) selenium transferase [Proteobacteria bacterium]|nr:L-seryl-tRNA(Sec) selenium transferase [Pseudomonadota bacterium]